MFSDSKQPAEEKKLRIFTHDFGHDVDDEVAFTMLCRSIAEGTVKPEEVVIIVTGDYPKQGMYAAYDIASELLGEAAAFKMTIIPAARYAEKSPGSEDDILCANGVKWSAFAQSKLAALKATLAAQNDFYSKNQAAIEEESKVSPNDDLACECLQQRSTEATGITVALCSKNGGYLDAINVSKVSLLTIQVDAQKELIAGFNNTPSDSSNLVFISKVSSASAKIIAVDTTAASQVLNLQDTNAALHQGRYAREKMQQWYFRDAELAAVLNRFRDKKDYTLKEIAEALEQIDPRLHGFAACWPNFTRERYLNERFSFSGNNPEKIDACKNEFVQRLSEIADVTSPRKNSNFNQEIYFSCFKTDTKNKNAHECFFLKEEANLSGEQKAILAIIEKSKGDMATQEMELIEKLKRHYPDVTIQAPSKLYDPLVVALAIEPEKYAQFADVSENKVQVQAGDKKISMSLIVGPNYKVNLPFSTRLDTDQEAALADLIANHYNYGLAPSIQSLLVNDLPKEEILTELKRQITDNASYWTPAVRCASIKALLAWQCNVLAKEKNSLSAGFYGSHSMRTKSINQALDILSKNINDKDLQSHGLKINKKGDKIQSIEFLDAAAVQYNLKRDFTSPKKVVKPTKSTRT